MSKDIPVIEAQPFVDGLRFGECPRWHDGPALVRGLLRAAPSSSAGPTGDARVEVDVPGEPAGLGWLPDGRLLVVARRPRTVLRREPDGRLVVHGDLNPLATFHGNDMVVAAPAGPTWATSASTSTGSWSAGAGGAGRASGSTDGGAHPGRPGRLGPSRPPPTSSSPTAWSSPRTDEPWSWPRPWPAG